MTAPHSESSTCSTRFSSLSYRSVRLPSHFYFIISFYILFILCIILYHISLYYIILYYIILYHISLYYIILYYIILYYIILYYIISYYIILYYIILYYILLYSRSRFTICSSCFIIHHDLLAWLRLMICCTCLLAPGSTSHWVSARPSSRASSRRNSSPTTTSNSSSVLSYMCIHFLYLFPHSGS